MEEVGDDHRTSAIARALQVRNADLRCRLRGVHLDIGYVNDICVSRHVDECVFLDETRPDVRVAPAGALDHSGSNNAKRALEKGGTQEAEPHGGDAVPSQAPAGEQRLR
jgi:hypothetical protein